MIPGLDLPPTGAPLIDPAADVVMVEIPIPLDVPFSDVLVTTWSDYTLVCSLVYAVGLIMGAVIWEVRARRIQNKRAARQE
jgi:hypothetical protein